MGDGSEYHGSFVDKYEPKIIQDWHRPRIEALLEGGVDVLAFETIPSVVEAVLLVELLKKYPHAKAWLSFTGKVRITYVIYLRKKRELLQNDWPLQE